MALLELFLEAYQIFQWAGWITYFERLGEFDPQQVLEFAQNFQEDHSIVQGIQISVIEEDIAQVLGFPVTGARWFSRKHIILNAQQDFLLPEEQVEIKGRGIGLHSLPPPWPKVAKFVKHYLTCEGCYQVVYQHDFVLMSHLRHGRLVKIPYYLLGCIKNMSYYCRRVKFPALSLTHHRLCQLLIRRGFAQQNPPLNNPPLLLEQAPEIPQEAEIPQEIPKSSYEWQLEDIPNPPLIPSSEPVDLSPSPSHLAESSHPIIHIPSDDSQY